MRKEGYSTAFAAGLTAGSSLIGPIIPPSIFMILYASLTNTSVGDLFLAGVIPGLLLAPLHGHERLVCPTTRAREARRLARQCRTGTRRPGRPAGLIAPFIIVAGIVMGLVTPTESGALTALYVALYGLAMGNLGPRDFWRAIVDTTRLTAAIFIIMPLRPRSAGCFPTPRFLASSSNC